MKAMLLAAGRGERMGVLTERCPKPLLEVGGMTLLERQIRKLAAAGADELVINVAYRAEMIKAFVAAMQAPVRIRFSEESPAALETAGGIVQALPWLGEHPFWLVSSDVITDFDITRLEVPTGKLGCLLLVPNPPHHPGGDFGVDAHSVIDGYALPRTFGGMACFRPELFAGLEAGFRPLRPVLDAAIRTGELVGECYDGPWLDVGTPERLQLARASCAGGTGEVLQ